MSIPRNVAWNVVFYVELKDCEAMCDKFNVMKTNSDKIYEHKDTILNYNY
jgi:hypothetical protein